MNNKIIERRIKETISCKDCEYIPKIDKGGQIIDDGDGVKYQYMHNGIKIIEGCYHSWMTTIIEKLGGHHEPQEEKVFFEILKHISPKATMIELGSNWAYYSLWFNKEIINARNFMIEPNLIKLEVGKKNFTLNMMEGSFQNACIGKEYIEEYIFKDWDNQEYQLAMVSIDYFIKKHRLNYVNLVHSDIQGAEIEMLEGSTSSIKNNKIGYFMISTHGDIIHKKCLKLLNKYEFKIIAEHLPSESFSADGLIAAASNSLNFSEKIKISKKRSPYTIKRKITNKIKSMIYHLRMICRIEH